MDFPAVRTLATAAASSARNFSNFCIAARFCSAAGWPYRPVIWILACPFAIGIRL